MKQLFLFIAALTMPLFLGSCQEKLEWELKIDIGPSNNQTEDNTLIFEEIMPLGGHLNPHPQGGDCWGDYFFQFATNNSVVRIYNLFTKTLEQTLSIPTSQRGFVSNCHGNTAKFGTEYYDPEDLFPLMYVSTGYSSGGYTGALVYRIVQHQGVFFITLVQTIKFPVVGNSSWTEFIPADKYAYLCYTSERVIYKFEMPKLKDGDIILCRESALETYQFTPQPSWMATSRNQDRLFYKGKIAFISGVPGSGEASVFILLNLENREREMIVDFKKIGLKDESESIFIWQGDLCIAFVDKIIRIVNL